MRTTSRRNLIFGTAAAAMFVGGLFAYYLLNAPLKPDARMLAALQSVQALATYEMEVETMTSFSDRTLAVAGRYTLDFLNDSFASKATSTLTIPTEPAGAQRHSFTLENISIADDVYLRIDTDSALLQTTIPHSKDWRVFKASAIPPQFTDIAVHGPVLHNLALFTGNGKYLRLIEKPQTFDVAGVSLTRYRFELSDAQVEVEGGTLRSLMNRIGRGSVDVWLDETPSIRVMTIRGDNYTSTTTILGVNIPVSITRPVDVEQ